MVSLELPNDSPTLLLHNLCHLKLKILVKWKKDFYITLRYLYHICSESWDSCAKNSRLYNNHLGATFLQSASS